MSGPPRNDTRADSSRRKRLVSVVFLLPLRQEFTYCVPAEWEDTIGPGSRVRAPLNGRMQNGVVVECPTEHSVPPGRRILPLSAVADPDLRVPCDILELTRWIADYYVSSWGEALACALGTTVADGEFVYRLRKPDWESSRNADTRLTATEHRILGHLSTKKAVTIKNLLSLGLTGRGLSQTLRTLLARDLVVGEWRAKRPPLPNEATLSGLSPELADQAPTQVRDFFSQHQGNLFTRPWTEFASQFPGGRAALRAMMLDEIIRWDPIPPRVFGDGEKSKREPGPDQFDEDQRSAHECLGKLLDERRFAVALLWGPTGSGKTAVYCEAIRHARSIGRTALFLVPEITLAGQMIQRLESTLGERVGVWHSGLTSSQRHWMSRMVARGRYRLVVGARSAVFAQIPDLGLIIVDEEHGESYKQSDPAPRYHARDVAVVRARLGGALCLLGSATPSCETYHNVLSGKYELLRLQRRVRGSSMPLIRLVDLSKRRLSEAGGWVTGELKEALRETLTKGRKAIVFLNRRGHSTMVACGACGHFLVCPQCDLTMTYHAADRRFRCHLCAHQSPAWDRCPKCGGTEFLFKGVGTQKIEESLHELDPLVRLVRLDADVAARRGATAEILSGFVGDRFNLLVGTQMVAKGLDIADVGVVGVIWADQQMTFPDFRAEERTFQLLTQVAGRAGRGEGRQTGEVIVQTFRPDHILIELAAAQDPQSFLDRELPRRQALDYPPYSHLILLSFDSPDAAAVRAAAACFAHDWKKEAALAKQSPGHLLGPAPAAVPRRVGRHVIHILIKTHSVPTANAIILSLQDRRAKELRQSDVALSVDVDPMDFW